MSKYICPNCKYDFKQKSHYIRHIYQKKNPCKIIKIDLQNLQKNKDNNNMCTFCNKTYSDKYTLSRHQTTCKKKKDTTINLLDKIIDLEQQITILKNINKPKKNIVVEKLDIINDSINKFVQPSPINEKLVNMVIKKEDQIEELKTYNITKNKLVNIIDDNDFKEENEIIKLNTLNVNNIVIESRQDDNYINATQMCKAYNKKFNDWFLLDSTKELIKALKDDVEISTSSLVEFTKGNKWLHPDLAGQLAQWISPIFGLKISKWIRSLFTNGRMDLKALKDKDIEIKTKDKKIKVLENLCVKKHSRKVYPGKNVIYMLTTEEHKKSRTYIIGKAKNLQDRLSTYNKTCDHEVAYYKECKSEEDMKVIEEIILLKLDKYREVANHDRVILPIDNEIKLFTDIIDNSVNIFN